MDNASSLDFGLGRGLVVDGTVTELIAANELLEQDVELVKLVSVMLLAVVHLLTVVTGILLELVAGTDKVVAVATIILVLSDVIGVEVALVVTET